MVTVRYSCRRVFRVRKVRAIRTDTPSALIADVADQPPAKGPEIVGST